MIALAKNEFRQENLTNSVEVKKKYYLFKMKYTYTKLNLTEA